MKDLIFPLRALGINQIASTFLLLGILLASCDRIGSYSKSPSAPPTPTLGPPATSEDCPGIVLRSGMVIGNMATWFIENNTDEHATLREIRNMVWPSASSPLLQIRKDDKVIWGDGVQQGAVISWGNSIDGAIAPHETTEFEFRFTYEASQIGYAFELVLEPECILVGKR